STYMRQLALTIIMGQIGCFVPADEAEITIFDQIFTRIGAADDLVSGQSTFMVEMMEANHALTNATENSLILLDEIGRGTSTYDGMALAHAIIDYIHHYVKAKTLFSTHYHELTELEDELPHLKNIYVRAEEYDDKIVFLHKISDGRANESYGIQVAKLASMPTSLIERATTILQELEAHGTTKTNHSSNEIASANAQLSFFQEEVDTKTSANKDAKQLITALEKINILEMTPMDAMNELYKLQQLIRKEKRVLTMRINQLPDILANKIAAGEVVERPASVIKELIENSIDANSTSIKVELQEAGLTEMKVTDNGEGMGYEDCKRALLRHATSKIKYDADLFHIASLGFRGEALASIAAVSKLTIMTSTGNEAGTKLYLEAGHIVDESKSPARQGTEIIVRELFYNTPARLKYMKTIHTEL